MLHIDVVYMSPYYMYNKLIDYLKQAYMLDIVILVPILKKMFFVLLSFLKISLLGLV